MEHVVCFSTVTKNTMSTRFSVENRITAMNNLKDTKIGDTVTLRITPRAFRTASGNGPNCTGIHLRRIDIFQCGLYTCMRTTKYCRGKTDGSAHSDTTTVTAFDQNDTNVPTSVIQTVQTLVNEMVY
jgi:hypothetical protein